MAEYTRQKMVELGYDEVTVDEAGSVLGVIRGTGGGKSVMLNCHLDVVDIGDEKKWIYPPLAGTVAEGRLWGRGASDTKGTFAIQLYTPVILKENGMLPKGDIYVSGVVHEEDCGYGAVYQVENNVSADYTIVGEATENDLAFCCRGRIGIEVKIIGKACHASAPENGRNPFAFLAKFLPELEKYECVSDPVFGTSQLSMTKIESSEKVINTIPSSITLTLDYRNIPQETGAEVVSKIQRLADACKVPGIEVSVGMIPQEVSCYTGHSAKRFSNSPAFGISPDSDVVIRSKQALEEVFGHEVKVKPWKFGTDCGSLNQHGSQVIGYAPAEAKYCHTSIDQISLDMLRKGIVGHLALAETLANTPV